MTESPVRVRLGRRAHEVFVKKFGPKLRVPWDGYDDVPFELEPDLHPDQVILHKDDGTIESIVASQE